MNDGRLEEVYEYLVELTVEREVISSREKSHLLSSMLALCEYLRGEDKDNPIQEIFGLRYK